MGTSRELMATPVEPYAARFRELIGLKVAGFQFICKLWPDLRDSYVALDLDGIQRYVGEQQKICNELTLLDVKLKQLRDELASAFPGKKSPPFDFLLSQLDAGAAEPVWKLLGELASAQAEAARLNRVHAALLRASRRTINGLANLVASYAGTYELKPGENSRGAWTGEA